MRINFVNGFNLKGFEKLDYEDKVSGSTPVDVNN